MEACGLKPSVKAEVLWVGLVSADEYHKEYWRTFAAAMPARDFDHSLKFFPITTTDTSQK